MANGREGCAWKLGTKMGTIHQPNRMEVLSWKFMKSYVEIKFIQILSFLIIFHPWSVIHLQFFLKKKVTQITLSKCDSWMKFHWWNLMDKKLNEKINFHGIEFIYEIMVSIQYIPWTSICVVFNDKANIRLHTETKKTRVLLGRFSTHYWLSFKIQLHWRTPLNIERPPPQPSKETWSQK